MIERGDVSATVHASAVLAGAGAVLIRGASGSGKSRLAWELLQAAAGSPLPFARLVADDRVLLQAVNGRLLVRPAAELAGLIEIRGLGIRRLPYEPMAVVRLIVDLDHADAARLPAAGAATAVIDGVTLPRIALAAAADAFAAVVAALTTPDALTSRERIG